MDKVPKGCTLVSLPPYQVSHKCTIPDNLWRMVKTNSIDKVFSLTKNWYLLAMRIQRGTTGVSHGSGRLRLESPWRRLRGAVLRPS